MDKCYTGVGSRSTPEAILAIIRQLAHRLGQQDWTLRSGGAAGADFAFEQGCNTFPKEIYYANDATPEAMAIAGRYHPVWERCGEYARKLHGRNSFQVLGRDLQTPSAMVICWTPDGCISHDTRSIKTGGTGTAISIAHANGIDVINLAVPAHLERAQKYLDKF